MGLFWNLIQQSQIEEQKNSSQSLEQRVRYLENELRRTQDLLVETLKVLEAHTGQDVDGDGKIG
ncbi:MAG: hypothetical protein ACJAT1_000438 [Marivirga sp.]|jgi:hypothetical protein